MTRNNLHNYSLIPIYTVRMRTYYVYILTNKRHTVLYIGMTSDLVLRSYQHRNKLVPGFTKKYNCTKLIYFEEHDDVGVAIFREKMLKKWERSWKENLINTINPDWIDFYDQLNMF
ncbi:MAG: nuclease [marine bacterium B5-7]|nr:MAG: nuclease [marine bacterium B5-7]